MISFKICSDSLCLTTDNSSQAGTFDDMIRRILESSGDSPLTEIRFGACYEHVPSGFGWRRITYLIGKGEKGKYRTLGICDVKPETNGKLIYMDFKG